VKSHKIIKDLNYKFIYPNPLEFWDWCSHSPITTYIFYSI
jgi:hypothetical protein